MEFNKPAHTGINLLDISVILSILYDSFSLLCVHSVSSNNARVYYVNEKKKTTP